MVNCKLLMIPSHQHYQCRKRLNNELHRFSPTNGTPSMGARSGATFHTSSQWDIL